MLDAREMNSERSTRGFLAYAVERANAKLMAQTTEIISKHTDLTLRQWWIIADMMSEEPETAAELSRIADVDKGLLSRNLRTMAAKGLVEMRADPTDDRRQLISLTDSAREIHERMIPILDKRNEALVRDMTMAEVDALVEHLGVVTHAAQNTDF